MKNYYIFDIAVYLNKKDDYYKEMNERLNRHLNNLFISTGVTREQARDSFAFSEDHFKKAYGGPWHFNQVVGWIRLYAESSHIGAHLWWAQAKRLQRKMSHKLFYLTTPSNLLATHFMPQDNSEKIFQDTLADIKRLSKEMPLKGRVIDLEIFTNVGPFINWRELLNRASKR